MKNSIIQRRLNSLYQVFLTVLFLIFSNLIISQSSVKSFDVVETTTYLVQEGMTFEEIDPLDFPLFKETYEKRSEEHIINSEGDIFVNISYIENEGKYEDWMTQIATYSSTPTLVTAKDKNGEVLDSYENENYTKPDFNDFKSLYLNNPVAIPHDSVFVNMNLNGISSGSNEDSFYFDLPDMKIVFYPNTLERILYFKVDGIFTGEELYTKFTQLSSGEYVEVHQREMVKLSLRNGGCSYRIINEYFSNYQFYTGSSNRRSTSITREYSTKVFPNPASNQLNIENEVEITDIKLFDMYGNNLKLEKIAENKNEIVLDLSIYSHGMYVVYITDKNGQTHTHKFTKN